MQRLLVSFEALQRPPIVAPSPVFYFDEICWLRAGCPLVGVGRPLLIASS